VIFEGKICVKFNSKVASMGRGANRRTTKGKGRIKDFWIAVDEFQLGDILSWKD